MMPYLLSDRTERSRIRGTAAQNNTDDAGVVYEVPAGSAPVLLEVLNFTAGASRTVSASIVTPDETWSAGDFDFSTSLAVDAGDPANADTNLPQLLYPGDKLVLVASGSGVRFNGILSYEPRTNRNRGGV